jgi:hypothetical protein
LCPYYGGADIWIYPCPAILPFSCCVACSSKRLFYLGSWNFTGMLVSKCSWAPGFLHVELIQYLFKVFALDLVKICNFQLVLHIAQKISDLGSRNFTEMIISMWSYAQRVSLVDLFSICRVITLDLVKIWNFSLGSYEAQKVFDMLFLVMVTLTPGGPNAIPTVVFIIISLLYTKFDYKTSFPTLIIVQKPFFYFLVMVTLTLGGPNATASRVFI